MENFSSKEAMKFNYILNMRLIAKYSVSDLYNYAIKLGNIQTSFGKIDAKSLSISNIIDDFLHVEVMRKIEKISCEEVDRVLKEIFFAGI